MIHVCLLGKDCGLTEAIGRALGAGFETRQGGDFEHGCWLNSKDWCDIVLVDLRAAGTGGNIERGLELMDEIQLSDVRPPMVAFCEEDDDSGLAMRALAHGAYDTVTNPLNIVELRLILQRAHKVRSAEKELDRLRAVVEGRGRLHGLLGSAANMQELFSVTKKIAACDVSVLITGETGTGKELLARAIHELSSRAPRAFVAFSCVNLPETLIEDELFGHEKGAFTGALAHRRGRLEAADRGTLFLDEIGDIATGLQPKLLRVLQERSFERLGSNAKVNVNIRLVSATNRNLSEMVQEGKFREDLYYRLNVVHLHLPPLRDRRDDIPLLAHHFLHRAAQDFNKSARKFSRSALYALEEHAWPGNVRELENVVQRAVVLSDGPTVEIWNLPNHIRSNFEKVTLNSSYEQEVREFKRRLVLRTLRACDWRIAESARTLGLARGYLHRLINQLDIRNDNLVLDQQPQAVSERDAQLKRVV